MCLSRFTKKKQVTKKTNNEKGEVKLLNHSKILLGLGEKWIKPKVYTELYTVDLMDIKSKVSYIDRSRDYKLFYKLLDLCIRYSPNPPCTNYKTISPQTKGSWWTRKTPNKIGCNTP